MKSRKPTIQQLEELLESDEESPIEILPNGEVRARARTGDEAERKPKPLTMREQLGGEYGEASR